MAHLVDFQLKSSPSFGHEVYMVLALCAEERIDGRKKLRLFVKSVTLTNDTT